MKALLISSALALEAGSPTQRAAFALRRALGQHSAVSQITIDVWGSEWAARSRMASGDRLMPSRRIKNSDKIRSYLSLPQRDLNPPVSLPEINQPVTPASLKESWMSPGRNARILKMILDLQPDLIVVTDPLLADFAVTWRACAAQIVLLDNGLVDWAREASAISKNSDHSKWFRQLADAVTTSLNRSRHQFDRIISTTHGTSESVAPLIPFQFTQNELFFSKAHNLVVPSTGFTWIDFLIMGQVRQFVDHCTARQVEPPNLIFVGMERSLTTAFANAQTYSNWQKLNNLVGAARCLFVPFLTADLAQLALSAVSLGTPVLTSRRMAALYGLSLQTGVFSEIDDAIVPSLVQIMDADWMGTDQYRAISTAAGPVTWAIAQERLMRLIFQSDTDADTQKPLPRVHAPDQDARPARRISPFSAEPCVLYNPATQMLLLRLQLLASGQIDEVHLFDSAGTELNRLATPTIASSDHSLTMEGGVVVSLKDLGPALVVELHDSLGLVARHRVDVESFETIAAEIAIAYFDDNMFRGALWVLDTELPKRWAVGFEEHKSPVSMLAAKAMPEIGATALPFAIPLAANLSLSSECHIWRGGANVSLQNLELAVQRPHRETKISLATNRHPRTAVTSLKDIHRGKRAWIVGNGPSVRLEDVAQIPKDDVTFCFNRFYLSYADNPLRESYVVSADTLMVEDYGQEMIDISAGLPLFCIAPGRLPKLSGEYVLLPWTNHYLPIFSHNPEKFVNIGGSSVFVALQMAWYMGIRDVVLYGMDYSFTVKMQRDPRFPFPVSFEEGNHFIKSYRGAKPWCPPTWRDISAGFINARVAYELTGGRILNATRGGKLHTFARGDFDEICRQPVAEVGPNLGTGS
jgi:hypothetical protein